MSSKKICPYCGFDDNRASYTKCYNCDQPLDNVSVADNTTTIPTGVVIRPQVSYGSAINFRLCPFCREEIKTDAIKCKHCGEMLVDIGSEHPPISIKVYGGIAMGALIVMALFPVFFFAYVFTSSEVYLHPYTEELVFSDNATGLVVLLGGVLVALSLWCIFDILSWTTIVRFYNVQASRKLSLWTAARNTFLVVSGIVYAFLFVVGTQYLLNAAILLWLVGWLPLGVFTWLMGRELYKKAPQDVGVFGQSPNLTPLQTLARFTEKAPNALLTTNVMLSALAFLLADHTSLSKDTAILLGGLLVLLSIWIYFLMTYTRMFALFGRRK